MDLDKENTQKKELLNKKHKKNIQKIIQNIHLIPIKNQKQKKIKIIKILE